MAAIVAALAAIDADERARAAAAAASAGGGDEDRIDAWVHSARLSGRAAGFTPGSVAAGRVAFHGVIARRTRPQGELK